MTQHPPRAFTYWRSEGDGADMYVLLHGIGSSSTSFDAQFRHLSARAKVCAWDAPGYRKSDDPLASLTDGEYVETVLGFVERERDGREVHLVGSSWGGVLAMLCARADPSTLASLILVSSSLGAGTSDERSAEMLRRPRDLASQGSEEFARLRASRLLSPGAAAGLVQQASTIMSEAIRIPGYTSAAEMMARTDASDLLSHIDVRTLIVVGEDDIVTGPRAGRVIFDRLPNASYALIPRAGHLVHQERPETFNDHLACFVAAA